MENFPSLKDDGLPVESIGSWAVEKYRLTEYFSKIFLDSMRNKWERLVYIDLFSGSGRSIVEGKANIIPATPLIILNLEKQFDKYIFCEVDSSKHNALSNRIKTAHPDKNTVTLLGDSNNLIDEILKNIPPHSKKERLLCFCFADPYKIDNLRFETIKSLATLFVDFLILLPSGMDVNRNESIYNAPQNEIIANFCGDADWRIPWEKEKIQGKKFEAFFVELFGKSMSQLGYIDPGVENTVEIRIPGKNVLLYRLALYSRHKLGGEFWKQAKKYTNPQTIMFD